MASFSKGKPAGNRPSLDDYVDVAERIQDFKDTYPEGSLQTVAWEVRKIDDATYIVYQAAAYRTPDDERPGFGIAWEPWPGKTPYTRESELMNAETAAWGRAICALGLVANRHLASRQEVRNRQAEQDAEPAAKSESKPTPRRKTSAPAEAATNASEDPKVDHPAASAADDPAGSVISAKQLDAIREAAKRAGANADRMALSLVEAGVVVDPDAKDGVARAMKGLSEGDALALLGILGVDDPAAVLAV